LKGGVGGQMKKRTFIIIAIAIFSCKPKDNTQQELTQLLDFTTYTEQVADSVSDNFSYAIINSDSLETYQSYESLKQLFLFFNDSLNQMVFSNESLNFLKSRYLEYFTRKYDYIENQLPELIEILTKSDEEITMRELEKLKQFNIQSESNSDIFYSQLLSERDSIFQKLSIKK
jgi:hypothetical protein